MKVGKGGFHQILPKTRKEELVEMILFAQGIVIARVLGRVGCVAKQSRKIRLGSDRRTRIVSDWGIGDGRHKGLC